MQPQKGRFENVDFFTVPVEKINPDIAELCRGFRCKRPEFQSYIKGNVIKIESKSHLSQCFIIQHENRRAGYVTLLADKLVLKDQILLDEGVQRTTFPAVKIGWLAKDKRASNAGARLLMWAIDYVAERISPNIGVRFVTVDALYDKDTDPHTDMSTYYAKYGFEYVDEEEVIPPVDGYRSMYFDLKLLLDPVEETKNELEI